MSEGFWAWFFCLEPHIAVAFALTCRGVQSNLAALDLAELLEQQVQVFTGQRLIQACDAQIALETRVVWQIT